MLLGSRSCITLVGCEKESDGWIINKLAAQVEIAARGGQRIK